MSHKKYHSRKFWLAIFAITVISIFGFLCCKFSGLSDIYATLVSSVVAIVSAYYTGNVFQKKTQNKANESTESDSDKTNP